MEIKTTELDEIEKLRGYLLAYKIVEAIGNNIRSVKRIMEYEGLSEDEFKIGITYLKNIGVEICISEGYVDVNEKDLKKFYEGSKL